jgi:signal transduction histidine kinase
MTVVFYQILVAAMAVLLSLGVAVLAWMLLRGRSREAALRQELEAQESRLRQTMAMQEEERKRFSGALHEEIGMRLHSLRLSASRLAERSALHSPEQGAEIRRIAEGLDQAARDIKALSDKLLPRVLAEQGLDAALAELTDQVFRHTAIQASYTPSAAAGRYGQQVEIATYRMARELLSNAARHAGARQVTMHMERNGYYLLLTVRDDGRGFDTARVRERDSGLQRLESHLQSTGGKASFSSQVGEGTTVTLRIPIA